MAVPSSLAVTTRVPLGLYAAVLSSDVPGKRRKFAASVGIPDFGGAIGADGDDAGSVGAERRGIDPSIDV